MLEAKGEIGLKEMGSPVISHQETMEIREGNQAISLKEMEAEENPVTNPSTMQLTSQVTSLSNRVPQEGSLFINLNSKAPQEGNQVTSLKEMEMVEEGQVTDLHQVEVQETANLPIRTICNHLKQHK